MKFMNTLWFLRTAFWTTSWLTYAILSRKLTYQGRVTFYKQVCKIARNEFKADVKKRLEEIRQEKLKIEREVGTTMLIGILKVVDAINENDKEFKS